MPTELNVKLHCRTPKVSINEFEQNYRVVKKKLIDPSSKEIINVNFLNSTKCISSSKKTKKGQKSNKKHKKTKTKKQKK